MARSARTLTILLAAAALAPAPGCAVPKEIAYDSPNPQARVQALARSARDGDPGAVPEMITMLGSDDPAQRMLAIHALERETGQTLGYVHYAPEHERLAARDRWAEWFRARGQQGGAAPRAAADRREAAP